ncbi:hypothetical protein Taro_043393, partial [Colocasia esculenta]|nr:hypothetical protein [Colocasia esculenta]
MSRRKSSYVARDMPCVQRRKGKKKEDHRWDSSVVYTTGLQNTPPVEEALVGPTVRWYTPPAMHTTGGVHHRWENPSGPHCPVVCTIGHAYPPVGEPKRAPLSGGIHHQPCIPPVGGRTQVGPTDRGGLAGGAHHRSSRWRAPPRGSPSVVCTTGWASRWCTPPGAPM